MCLFLIKIQTNLVLSATIEKNKEVRTDKDWENKLEEQFLKINQIKNKMFVYL